MNDHDKREETLFITALQLATPEERAAYLKGACADDEPLRQRVLALLQAHDSADGTLDKPAAGLPARTVALNPAVIQLTEKAGDKIGRYKLLQQIGEGGCGVVYMADQEEPVRRRVALKVIKLGMDTKQVIARFEAERQALALMDHPNIAKVLDAGATETGRPYFVMELVRGIRITDYCDQNNLPTRDRLNLFNQVCNAIQHAHQKGIIHRDIKPSNILVTMHDGVPVPKVIDFGIAKATEQRLTDKTLFTAFEQFMGTPAYMSPEQAEMSGLGIDTRSDIYALGTLLYELLTGKTPFDAKELLQSGLDEMRRTIREKEPARPSTCLSTMQDADLTAVAGHRQADPAKLTHLLRGDLDWVVMKCLEKDRTRRYETASGLATDIQRYLNNEPVAARPASSVYRFQKLVRRNKLVFAGIAIIATVLLLGTIVSTWQAVRANREAELAEARRKEADLSRQSATTAQARAERLAKVVSRRLAPLYVDKGAQQLDQGDDYASLVWFTEALRLDEDDPTTAKLDRLRIGTVLHQCPKPRQLFLHKARVLSVQFSPDGRLLVTGGGDKTAQIWNAVTGTPLNPPLEHGDEVVGASFSPDGWRVVTASLDNTARVWDVNTGAALSAPMQHASNVYSAVFSPDGARVATASADHTARVWDPATGRPVTPPLQHDDAVWPASFSPDGRFVLTASQDKTARIWDAETGQPFTPPLRHPAQVWWATFSPNGKLVATACEDHTARLWDAKTGAAIMPPLQHPTAVTYVAFSPDGKRLVTACGESIFDLMDSKDRPGEARVWDVTTGKPLTPPMPHRLSVYYAVFSPDGRFVATASQDKTARVWDSETGEPFTAPLVHQDAVFRAAFSPDSHLLATASFDSAARTWEVESQQPPATTLQLTFLCGHFLLSPDGTLVAGTCFGNSARVWNAQTGEATPKFMTNTQVNNMAFSPDSRLVAAAGDNGTARVWDAHTGAPVSPLLRHGAKVNWIAFSPDGQRVVTASADNTGRIWNVQTGQPLIPALYHGNTVLCAAFSPDGREVVTASDDKTARVWDAATGAPITPPLPHKDGVELALFNPDGRHVATADWSGNAQIWDAKTGAPVTPVMKQAGRYYLAGIQSMVFSPDGGRLIIADSNDKSARIWDANTGAPITPPLQHGGEVLFGTFSHNGRYVLTVAQDKTTRVWDAATGQPITPFLQNKGGLDHAMFSPDDQEIKTVGVIKGGGFINQGFVENWTLASDNRPVADLLLLAQLLSLHHLDASGTYVPLDLETMTNRSWTLPQN